MADSHSSGDYSDVVSRRKFVSLAGTTGAAAVAGCIGDDGDDEGDDDTTDDDTTTTDDTTDDDTTDDDGGPDIPDSVDRWFTTFAAAFSPDQFQYNPAVAWFTPHDSFGLWAPWVKYLNAVDEFVPHLVTDWEHQDSSLVLTMRDDFTWGSGGSVTAEDLALQLEIEEDVGDTAWDFIESAEATGEYELTVEYGDSNPDFVEYTLLAKQANYPPSVWEDAEWDESPAEVEQIDPDPSGPLALTDATSNYNQTEPRDGLDGVEDHPLASNYNWNGYRLEYREGNNAAHQSFIAGELDGIHSLFVPPNQLEQFPDSVQQFQIPGNFGMAIWPDHSDEPWNVREVRQAFYYSLDRGAILANVGESTKVSHHPAPTGLTWASVETYLGSTEPEGFTVYERDTDQAESLLDDAGYSPGDIDATIAFPQGWSDWAVAAQSAIDQLNQAGWNASGDSRSGGPGGYANELGDGLDLAVDQHTPGGQPQQNLPYFGLDYILRNRLRDTESHFANYDTSTVTIDGDEIDIDATLEELASTTDDAEAEPLIRDLALIVNEDCPVFYMMEKYEQSFVDTAGFAIPDSSDHFNAFWPLWWLPKIDETLEGASSPGLLKATGDD